MLNPVAIARAAGFVGDISTCVLGLAFGATGNAITVSAVSAVVFVHCCAVQAPTLFARIAAVTLTERSAEIAASLKVTSVRNVSSVTVVSAWSAVFVRVRCWISVSAVLDAFAQKYVCAKTSACQNA